MTPDFAGELLPALRKTFGPRWNIDTDGDRFHIHHQDAGSPYRPPRRPPDWPELLERLEAGFARQGVPRVPPLPLRWGRDTDFTISAVQALDPYLKHAKPYTYGQGYLPQPVIRFTGKRDQQGQLFDGFATSFVNVSRVQPIHDVTEHAEIIDGWLSILSSLGIHARHIDITGRTSTWTRGPVSGITLHISHATIPIGDTVLLWNTANPDHLATDLGSGLERLRWTITRQPWTDLLHGPFAHHHDPATLDALRTATLALANGIHPASHGPGNAIRRLLRTVPSGVADLGLSRVVRHWHSYWSLTGGAQHTWATVTTALEDELASVLRETAPRPRSAAHEPIAHSAAKSIKQ
ncbi:hypothetical protein Athai_38730 [Actinocatenispora thailandica]|uniref:Uncharacterized protein n=1 Tax=Actinocatenispora thailandica TaxID=227318 RepID=A0A7R7DR68_9ACTN|nr:hypothetical protein [Actinocatenispora thailandica]BCJ36370.1 hypothetical protein Athai_38730 [Actinocatenispora thailandica]